MLQTQKYESLAVLAGGVAHDFNNLLTGILGNVGLAAMDLPEQHRSAHASLAAIEKSAQRAADLTRQMLAFSGKGRFVLQTLQLDELVRDAIGLLTSIVPGKVSLALETPSPPPPVEADASQLRQALTNLVLNAVDAVAAESGSIRVRVYGREALREDLEAMLGGETLPEGLYAVLEVSDDGVGMDEATLARIFDPFFSTKFVGRGLGLAATLGIVRGHRGAIRARSRPGGGSTFSLLFPSVSWSRLSAPGAKGC